MTNEEKDAMISNAAYLNVACKAIREIFITESPEFKQARRTLNLMHMDMLRKLSEHADQRSD